jgi:hypothetical protein
MQKNEKLKKRWEQWMGGGTICLAVKGISRIADNNQKRAKINHPIYFL